MPLQMPEGKYMSTVKVGEKGQLVIPKAARDMFNIKPGDTLVLMADAEKGIALINFEMYGDIFQLGMPTPANLQEAEK